MPRREKQAVDETLERLRQQYPPILTTAQVAEMLDLNIRTIMTMASDGRLPASRLPGGRKFHFFLDEVIATLRENRIDPETVTADDAEG
ncbi:MAG TPA: helix-turn-helix domain-containing protein [Acidimicrobiales bacterium]|nr:helix-turn-helix domain-containing protein [Acidimicrobiales bacterium]